MELTRSELRMKLLLSWLKDKPLEDEDDLIGLIAQAEHYAFTIAEEWKLSE